MQSKTSQRSCHLWGSVLIEDLVQALAKVCVCYPSKIYFGYRQTFFMKLSTMVISYNPVPPPPLFFSPQRGIQDVHVESDSGGHTLHLVSGAFKLFNRKRRIRRLKREFSSCGRPLKPRPF